MTLDGEGQGSVLFVCVENAGRSQMAEAFATRLGIVSRSAGTIPSAELNPAVVSAMKEKGIDMSGRKPSILTQDMISEADLVVTMGCSVEEACPRPMVAAMRKKLIEWHIEDPKGKSIDTVRKIRDEIERKIMDLFSQKRLKQKG